MNTSSGAASTAYQVEHYGTVVGVRIAPLVLPPGVETSDLISDLRRSDHAPFWDESIPAILLTDTGDQRGNYYHCGGGEDRIGIVDFDFASQILRALVGAVATQLGAP